MPTLPPEVELLVRDVVEEQVTRRFDGFGSLLKYSVAAIAALFAVFGLKTCSDISSGTKAIYESQLRERLDTVDASSEVMQYKKRLATLYRRGLIDSALIRTQRQLGQYSSDRFRRPQVPVEDVNALLAVIRDPGTTDDDFATTLIILRGIAAMAARSDAAEIPSALNELLGRSPEPLPIGTSKPIPVNLSGSTPTSPIDSISISSNESKFLRSSRRAAVIETLGKLRYREAAQNVRGVMSDPTASDEVRLAAIEYAGLIQDSETVDSLIKLVASDNIIISKQAQISLAVIQPAHTTVTAWLGTLSAQSSMKEMALALNIAAALSRAEEGGNQLMLLDLEESKSKRQSDTAKLFKELMGIVSKSSYQLRRYESFFSDEDEYNIETRPVMPRSILLKTQESGSGFQISSAFFAGRMAEEEIVKLLASAMNDHSLAQVLRFFGATTDPEHLSSLAVDLEEEVKVSLEDGRTIDNTITSEVILLAGPVHSSKVAVFWRDPAGFTQSGSLSKVEGDWHPKFRVLAK